MRNDAVSGRTHDVLAEGSIDERCHTQLVVDRITQLMQRASL